MKKIFTLAAIAALVLSACAKIETVQTPEVDEPIAFTAYSGNALTKAGAYGEETTTALQTNGFGVFAYQTVGDYTSSATPNFMYNTLVSGDSWTYSPIKYWPNQIQAGDTDSQPATAFAAHKVTFFAYAPRVAATASTGVVADTNEGIIALTSNATAGDPKVTYKVTNDLDKQVDLLWAVSNGGSWANVSGSSPTELTAGKPYLNLQKPALNTAIHFYFKHALAQINLKAVAAYNQVAAGVSGQNGVKITIASVELTVPGMTDKAVLNLNNTTDNTPLWEAAAGATSGDLTLTVSGNNIHADLKDGGNVTAASQPTGVTGSEHDVIVAGKYFTVIPKTTATTVTVKVTYYVTTDDADLVGGKSRVENVISKTVTFDDGFAAGTKNTIKMILGISEVKFEAEVSDWAPGDSGDVNLPVNS